MRAEQLGVRGLGTGLAQPAMADALADLVWDSADIVVLSWLDERGIFDVNDAFEHYFGVARADALGRNGSDLNLWTDLDERAAILDAVSVGAPVNDMPVRLRTATGEQRIGHAWAGRCSLPGGLAAVFVFKDATESVRTEQMLALQRAVAELLSDGGTAESETAAHLMAQFGDRLDWQLGVYWRPDPAGGPLRCRSLWRSPSVAAERFTAHTRPLTFARRQGLPGLVWQLGEPLWVRVAPGTLPHRAAAAAQDGLRTGLGFPVIHGREVTGVFEMYCNRDEPVDDALRETAEVLGRQFGLFLRVGAAATSADSS